MKYLYRITYYDKNYLKNTTDAYMEKEDFLKIKPFLYRWIVLETAEFYRPSYYYLDPNTNKLKPLSVDLIETRPHYISDNSFFKHILKPITYDPIRNAKIIRAVRQALPLKEVIKGDQS